ncbi:copper resistance protein CopD [Arcobacter sp. AHV-9/2010]|uniref:copper resistance protein CopD n=1 Tax=Arcobacter sp. AHV-9/2010 TaxID=2021861 RepID=UPI00100C1C3E|nr:copper resistance protein CopD [Arcobacter sp. CECT 9299]RXJ96923.1 copper resistance protein CopD [Arcobacter sp. CECT 9299]
MEYLLIQTVHLLCAIIFVGFIFADIFIFPAVKKKLGQEAYDKMISAIVGRGIIIYPLVVVVLISSGIYMFTNYINKELGYFNSSLQILLWIKLFLVLLIILGVVYTIFCKLAKIEPIAFMRHFHTYALLLSIAIVVIAKLMFFL